MSFGFGVGDFLAVIKLASDIRKDFADAPEQFQQINAEIRNLVIVLGDVDVSLAAHDVSEDQNNNLKEIRESCRGVLEDSRKELSKYLSLDSKGGSLHERTKRVWKRVKWEPDDIRDLRHRITANIVALNSFTGSNIRDTVFKLEDRQIRQENREILEWLTPLDTAAQQADFISQRQEGTGQWLLDSNEYIKWKATKGEILFCHGIPGAGKTILSSIVVENLQDTFGIQTDVAICYFYFNFKSQGEQKFENVLLSLLKQLSQASATVPDDVQALFNQCKSNRSRPSREGIIRTLSSVAGSFSRVLIVVDALDECESSNGCQRELISHLIELQRNTGVNILATSRPVPHIVERFKEFTSAEVRASEGDIHRYVESNLMNLPRFVSRDKELQDEIKKGITKAVDGMFLLAKLHLDSLKGKKSPRALRQTLNTLATGNDAYDEAYQNTMLRISGQLSDQKELGMNTLMWIVHAKRPLETVELQHALGVEIGESELFEDSLPDLDDLVSACCGLVTIDEESHIIRLIHYTTQEFFDRHGVRFFPFAETQITNTCVTYLAFDIFESGHCFENDDLRQRLTDFPLYGYSSQYWGQHADPQAESEPIRELLGRPNHAKACGQFLMALENQRHGFLSTYRSVFDMTGLHLAAYFGLAGVVGSILDDHLDPDIRDSKRRAPLWYAARNGHQDVVGQLLDRNCQPDGEDQNGATLFQQAVQNGHEAVIRLLLDYGADVNQMDKDGETPLYDAMDKDGETPLFQAASNGYDNIVRLLLDHGADVNHIAEYGETPLSRAAKHGYEAIMRLLLDHGAGVNHIAEYGETPLSRAAKHGHEAIVRLLLDHGAGVNHMDEGGVTPLSRAARNGREAIVEMLVKHGANINVRLPGNEPTLLLVTARRAFWRIVDLLLATGADHESRDIYGRSALVYAIIWDHPEAVDVLLAQNKLDLDAKDHWGSTAISFAARSGNVAAFRKIAALPNVDLLTRDSFGRTPLWWAQKQRHDIITTEILAYQRSNNHDMIETHMRPAIGEPVEFLNTGAYCDVCFASVSLYEPRFYCSWCDNDKLLVCQECHGLGARCFVEWHELLIYDEDVRSDY
ncbi:hypothetical protein PFICI_03851 [Pestalotiopsis fici W106-1]|uniref:Uncharacterized protein n=1 Tax=Pestalotiopsis fici (strain W106-1 / CGMCC3.15140) TaxID=1229662 RepID=W3XKS3_PESFW|nr:uncharacterized protein PFICI_03851 [Pestalotiopsis fici W106-1]ETS85826.1 hypothetical protein PFICI_03851 [Pestalotiopsis fici W106-1]